MGLRQQLAKVPPGVTIAVSVLVVGVAVWFSFRNASRPGDLAADNPVPLACATPSCGHTAVVTRGDQLKRATTPDGIGPAPGLKCDKCVKNTMAYAWQCPKDKTIFIKPIGGDASAAAKCPKCGWDALAADREDARLRFAR